MLFSPVAQPFPLTRIRLAGAAAFCRLAVPLPRDRVTGSLQVVLDQPSVLRGWPRQSHLVGCDVGQHHPCDVGAPAVHATDYQDSLYPAVQRSWDAGESPWKG